MCEVLDKEIIVRQRILSPFKHYVDIYRVNDENKNKLRDNYNQKININNIKLNQSPKISSLKNNYNENMNEYNSTPKTKKDLELRKLLNVSNLKKIGHVSTKFFNIKGFFGFPLLRLYIDNKLTDWSARGKLKFTWSKIRSHRYKIKCNDSIYRISQVKTGMLFNMAKNSLGMDAFGMQFDIYKLKEGVPDKNQNENNKDFIRLCRVVVKKNVSLPNVITRFIFMKNNKRLPITLKRISRPLKTTVADAFRSKYYINNDIKITNIHTEVLLFISYIYTKLEVQGISSMFKLFSYV